MPFLPIVGSDPTQMLGLLNTVLTVSLNPDGTINPAALSLGAMMYGDGSDGALMFTATPRTVSDAVLVPGSTTITSATANFGDGDVGLVLDDLTSGLRVLLGGTRIVSVQSTTVATMSRPPNVASATPPGSDAVTIGAGILAAGSYSSVTIPTGATVTPLYPAGDGAIFCSGEFYIDGTLDLGGAGFNNNGVGQSGPGIDVAISDLGTLLGGNGGAGAGNTGGVSYWSSTDGLSRQPFLFMALGTTATGGGGTGGGDGTHLGGTGGNGGIAVAIVAKTVVRGPNSVYNLQGAAAQAGGVAAGATYIGASLTPPLTVTAANDQLVYTPFGGGPVTFTVASGTYNTRPLLAVAVNAATGVGGPLSNFFTCDGFVQTFTAATPGTAANGATITPGANDITAALGLANPSTFAGGVAGGGNCGGGGGGADGWWLTIADSITGVPTVMGGGGAGGAGSGTGTAGTAGQAGFGVHYTPAGVTVQPRSTTS